MPEESYPRATEPQPPLGCALRLFWMLFGNVALFFAAIEVAASDRVGAADAAYAGVVVALILARYFDVMKLRGMTTAAAPAMRADLHRYGVLVAIVGFVGWAVARGLAAAQD